MRGRGQYLIDEAGVRHLDTRNNVAHVGHAHPRVARAVAAQAAELNTNTRYLHPNVCELAARLLATFPPPLGPAPRDAADAADAGDAAGARRGGVVFFVNSGTEANDLALRLAHAHATRARAPPPRTRHT